MDDDLYSIYGALAVGKNTFFVSNDALSDKNRVLQEKAVTDQDLGELMGKWREYRQVHPAKGQTVVSRRFVVLGVLCGPPIKDPPIKGQPVYKANSMSITKLYIGLN